MTFGKRKNVVAKIIPYKWPVTVYMCVYVYIYMYTTILLYPEAALPAVFTRRITPRAGHARRRAEDEKLCRLPRRARYGGGWTTRNFAAGARSGRGWAADDRAKKTFVVRSALVYNSDGNNNNNNQNNNNNNKQ